MFSPCSPLLLGFYLFQLPRPVNRSIYLFRADHNFYTPKICRHYIDTYTGLMHTLFALEDMYGLKIGEIDGEICLRLDKSDYSTYTSMFDMFHAWQEQAAKLEQGEITKEEYDQWRYKYPELDISKHWAKVPSQAVSDMLMEEFQKIEKEEKKTAKKKKQK